MLSLLNPSGVLANLLNCRRYKIESFLGTGPFIHPSSISLDLIYVSQISKIPFNLLFHSTENFKLETCAR